MGALYPLPDLDSPLVFTKMVVHEHGRLAGAAALKSFAEAFLWLDQQASLREKIRTIRRLSEVLGETARAKGLDEVSCWPPPEIEPAFAHMLSSLGWRKSQWANWTILLK